MIIDTHTHLDLITNDKNDINHIISVCQTNDIMALFNISVDYKGNFNSQKLAIEYPLIYFTVGIHPSEADNFKDDMIDDLIPLLSDKKCIGIGEIGIDRFRNYSLLENQKELFDRFLSLAVEYQKPVIIHSRQAFDDIWDILKNPQYKELKGIFHCYSYGYKEAVKCIDRGFLISFAGNLTYKNAKDLHVTAVKIPLESILVETDAPYLAPVPMRGKTNYPYYITHTIKFLSKLRGMPMNKIVKQLYSNAMGLFHLNN